MSANDKQNSTSDTMTRKQRRAAERAARKGGKSTSPSSGSSSSSSSGGSGPSILVVSMIAIAIGVVAVIALVLVSGGLGGDDAAAAVSEPDTAAPAEELREGRTLVASGAVDPVVVEVFEDPQCVHCGTFTERIEPLIVAGPVTDGTASFTYNDFIIFEQESLDAAVAMRVAEDMDGAFWDYHQILFHNQEGVEDGSFSRDRLADMAEMIGLDREDFLERMDDPAYVEAVEAERDRGTELGITSTPTVFVNGQMFQGSPAWEELRDAIEEAAAGA